MQADSIIGKAQKLGIDIGSGVNQVDKLRYIAEQVGVEDLSELEETLDSMLQEDNIDTLDDSQNIENLDNNYLEEPKERRERFGEREYKEAKDEHGVYDKNYYANRGKELDDKVAKAEDKKNQTQKEVLKKNEQGEKVPVQKNKNIFDKAKDNAELLKAKNDRFQNKLNSAKAKAYNVMHPGEALKDQAKSAVSNAAKSAGKKVGKSAAKAGSAAGKAVSKGASRAISGIVKLAASNPIALIILVAIIIVVLLILLMFSGAGGNNGSIAYGSACDMVSINNTSLSKTEFVGKVEEYFSGSTSAAALAFSENAELIYEIATDNNVNPELVVVRAVLEGFSPGGNTNNYWGMACYNTSSNSCLNYETFDEGVLDYVLNISQYESVSLMMSSYSYIGDYWYNPGSSSVGGCYYFPYIREFMSASRADEVENICSKNMCTIAGGEDCVKTTEEDQDAYAKWQVQKIAEVRKLVFGIEPDACKYSGDCIIYAQGDSNWGSVNLGDSSATMADSGCAVTAIAIGISCSGAELSVEEFDAGVFINTLNAGNCFTKSGNIYWGCSAMQNILPSIQFINSYDTSSYTEEEKNNLINSYSPENHFIIIHFENDKHPRGHYVVYTETSGDHYVTKDPAGGKISNQLISQIDQIVVYGFEKNIIEGE